jgi:hypothetical protein
MLLGVVTKEDDQNCREAMRYPSVFPNTTSVLSVTNAAVAAKISLLLAAVKRARHNENKAVIPAIMPIRAKVFSTKYSTITPTMGSTEESTVATRDDSLVIVRSE